MAYVMILSPTSYTHTNMGCLSYSWHYHVVFSPCLYNIMEECTFMYNTVTSDHCPLLIGLKLIRYLLWHKSCRKINQDLSWIFGTEIDRSMVGWWQSSWDVATDPVRLGCYQNTCLDNEHPDAIDGLLQVLIEWMLRAGKAVFGADADAGGSGGGTGCIQCCERFLFAVRGSVVICVMAFR